MIKESKKLSFFIDSGGLHLSKKIRYIAVSKLQDLPPNFKYPSLLLQKRDY